MNAGIFRFGIPFVLLAFIGCGPKNPIESYFVEGIVTLDGVKVSDAKIVYHPKDASVGETAFGRTDSSGYYTLTSSNGLHGYGAMAGEYIVTISNPLAKKLPPGVKRPDGREYSFTEQLPTVYQDEKNSPLSATIERKKKNTIDLELKK